MLEFIRLSVTNFGPYKDTQVLDFKDGVTIIWGDNGRGKTTLLNAFRYALFGKIVLRSKKRSNKLKSLCNLENSENGVYEFSVVLKMRYDGKEYELFRRYKLKPGLAEPKSDSDFVQDVSLKKGNSFLSPEQRDHYLNKIMPEQISRFFLFDGELLSEYEDLIDDEKEIGMKIKESIEKILGLPVLTNAYSDIKHALGEIQNEYATIAKKYEGNKEIVGALDAAKIKRNQQQKDLEDYIKEREEKHLERAGLEEDLKQTEKVRVLIERKSGLMNSIVSLEKTLESCREDLKKHNKHAWLFLLSGMIAKKTDEIENEIAKLENIKNLDTERGAKIVRLRKAIDSCVCPTCKRVLDEDQQNEFKRQLEEAIEAKPAFGRDYSERLEYLQGCKNRIKKHINDNIEDLIADAEKKLDDVIVEISSAKGQVDDLVRMIGSEADQDSILTIKADYNKLNAAIILLNRTITDLQEEITKSEKIIESLNVKLSKVATGKDVEQVSRIMDVANNLKDVFDHGITKYRDLLKGKVEMDASMLFKNISSEPDFKGLQINDNYGLNILFNDGLVNENRSAGYEHIVAISLIGALQKNAPMQGPVVMDSPFGRLDQTHSRRISSALQSLSHQVILFAYEGEIDMQTARETLGSSLTHEYFLKRVSVKHTQIITIEDV